MTVRGSLGLVMGHEKDGSVRSEAGRQSIGGRARRWPIEDLERLVQNDQRRDLPPGRGSAIRSAAVPASTARRTVARRRWSIAEEGELSRRRESCSRVVGRDTSTSKNPVAAAGVGGQGVSEVQVQFRRHQADPPLHVPDALPGPAPSAEDRHVVAVRLRVVAADQAQEGRFARPVRAEYRPALAGTDGPGDVAQDRLPP